MSFSLSGLGSGLDLQLIVSQLVQAERQTKQGSLNRRAATYNAELSGLAQYKSALSTFRDNADVLASETSLFKLAATSSDASRLLAEATSTSSAGSYTVRVETLASAQKLSSTGFSTSNDIVGTGKLTISSGANSFVVDITDGEKTLEGIQDAINQKADNSSVNATIISVDDGSGGTENRLVLTAKTTGTSSEITVAVQDDDTTNDDMSGLSILAYDGISATNLQVQAEAKDAIFFVDNAKVTRSTNDISDVIEGVTLSLLAADPSKEMSLSIEPDQTATKESVQAFVDAYNAYMSTVKQLTQYKQDSSEQPALSGDSIIRGITNQIRSTVRDSISNTSSYSRLTEIGLEIDQYGVMSIDSTKFDSILTNAPDALNAILGGDNGIASKISQTVEDVLESSGAFENRSDRLSSSLKGLEDERLRLDNRMNLLESNLMKQFIAMDTLVARYNNTGSYLANQLSNLPGFTRE